MSGAWHRNVYTPWMGLVYLVKMDETGQEEWSSHHGITNYENVGQSIQQTDDGGYIIAGITGYTYHIDAYIQRTDAKGELQWTSIQGEFEPYDNSTCVGKTSDGGFIISGWTASYGSGSTDAWLFKMDRDGRVEWKRTYGGPDLDGANGVQQTADGGYILVGFTESFDPAGNGDVWLIKTDPAGTESWTATFGGLFRDEGHGVQQTATGGYIITGNNSSYGGGEDVDVWLVCTDSQGHEIWNRTYGDSEWDEGKSVVQTADGGFFVTGDLVDPVQGDMELYMFKTDADGNEEWRYIIDHGGLMDSGACGIQTTDGGYIVTGETGEYNLAAVDALVLKLEGYNSPPFAPCCPVPEDEAMDVGLFPELRWVGGDPDEDVVTYDVFFGTSADPPLVAEGIEETAYQAGPLQPGTQYFWRVIATDPYGAQAEGPEWWFATTASTPVNPGSDVAPGEFAIAGVFPNPFNPSTTVFFNLPVAAPVSVRVFDLEGRLVRTLVSGDIYPAGVHGLSWDGRDDSGKAAGSGVYICRIGAKGRVISAKVLLNK